MASPTVLLGVTAPEAAWHFLKEQAVYLGEQGWQVHVATSPEAGYEQLEAFFAVWHNVHLHPIRMRRSPAPFLDFIALLVWIALLRRVQPDVVVVGTPKAGLLGIMAAWMTRVPTRVYQVRGLRLQTQRRLARSISWWAERIASAAATFVLCVSPSLCHEFVGLRLARPSKVRVLGLGSSHGVDVGFFRPGSRGERRCARQRFGVPKGAVVIGFAGRFSRDKGVPFLLEAFSRLRVDHEDVWLILAGQHEDPSISDLICAVAERDPHIRISDWMADMREFYWALDIFCLPSLREGMPNVNLEAAACGLPVISTTATGCSDSVVADASGVLVAPSDVESLEFAITALIDHSSRREAMGRYGRSWVSQSFNEDQVRESLNVWLASLIVS